jgi:hypothetical protein
MAPITLTQGHFKLLELCPRRFQYTYLDRLMTPTDPAMALRQQWGTQFHQIMQQRDLGLSVDALLAQDPHLKTAVEGLLTTAPALFIDPDPGLRQSEHRRTLAFNGYSLTVIYDLLILTPSQGQIIDWKTYLRPLQATQLAQDWQTRLYCYVLAETTGLAPEQITMDYWFVQPQGTAPPSRVSLPYGATQHRQIEQDLQRLTDTLTELMASPGPWPQVDEGQGLCGQCPFAVRCQRPSDRYSTPATVQLPAVADIAEVPL